MAANTESMRTVFRKIRPLPPLAFFTVLAAAIPVFSWLFLYPPPSFDAIAFIPASVQHHITGELINPLTPLSYNADPTNTGYFVYYVPLFPWLTGALMISDSAFAAFGVVALYRAVAVVLLSAVLWSIVRCTSSDRFRILLALAASAAVVGYAGMRLPSVGRPEALADLFILGALGSALWLSPGKREYGYLLFLGLTGATHPAGAVLLSLLAGMEIAIRRPLQQAIARLAAVVGGGFALCLVIISLSPNGLSATLEGMMYHHELLSQRAGEWLERSFMEKIPDIGRYWLLWWDRAFFGPVALLALGLLGAFPFRHTRKIESIYLYGTLFGLLLLAVWFFGIRIPPTSYNIALFYPLFLAVGFRWLTGLEKRSMVRRNAAVSLLLFLTLLPSLALVKYATEWSAARQASKGYHEAREVADSLKNSYDRIYFNKGLWVLFDGEDYTKMWLLNYRRPPGKSLPEGKAVIFVSSRGAAEDWKKGTEGLHEVRPLYDWEAAGRPTLFGVEVSSYPPGYSFRVFESTVERK